MKLRIKDDTIRIRLSQSEVNILKESGSVSSQCNITSEFKIQYTIHHSTQNEWQVSFQFSEIKIFVPEVVLSVFYDDSQVGFDHRISNGQPDGLYILIEKDFQCLTPRPHEDESDLFPNPQLTC
ncbi:MAG: hypothetical protein IPM42_16200 [Saprospiraceae bacterium]|nr:hypothetical protein [Saprospiraceae bacterium]